MSGNGINNVNLGQGAGGLGAPKNNVKGPDGKSFSEFIKTSLAEVNEKGRQSEEAIEKLQLGEAKPGEVMIAVKEAEVAFDMLMEVRNKIVDAYSELMRMQI